MASCNNDNNPRRALLFKLVKLTALTQELIIACFHVDDFVFMENSTTFFKHVMGELDKLFEFDGLKPLSHFLHVGTSITTEENGQMDYRNTMNH